MRGVIKGVLWEELQNSLKMKKSYEQKLRELPKGSMTIRKIRGHEYAYVAHRVGKKVRFIYKGKADAQEIARYKKAKENRIQIRKLLAQVKKQVKYLKGALRGKEAI